ncbi:MAG: hypothetical protein EAZ08_11505 [Cytophagales bacterium]|nr:MAG: hypothetical protein EAZ08_11505 [Cytophagales bacterium]
MRKNIKSIAYAVVALVLIGGLASMTMKKTSVNASKIKITNGSSWDIDNIYFSPVDKSSWGADILGSDEILEPGESITVLVDCATWDVKFVAEDDAECIVEDLDICEEEGTWTIDDLGCD